MKKTIPWAVARSLPSTINYQPTGSNHGEEIVTPCRSLPIWLCFYATIITACASPAERVADSARQFGHTPVTLEGRRFILAAYQNISTKPYTGALHVYIEGDGLPWRTPTLVADDPTPRTPLMLELMADDPAPSLYLGRPCYFGHAADPPCTPSLWTDRRYSATVVDAMSAALRKFVKNRRIRRLVFIGHSGGGALALLIANQFDAVSLVVTLAGNLDTDAWTKLHGFSPLTGSLNPALQAKRQPFPELHYLGLQDANLPPEIFEPIAKARNRASVILVNNADHACCWAQVWRDALRRLPE